MEQDEWDGSTKTSIIFKQEQHQGGEHMRHTRYKALLAQDCAMIFWICGSSHISIAKPLTWFVALYPIGCCFQRHPFSKREILLLANSCCPFKDFPSYGTPSKLSTLCGVSWICSSSLSWVSKRRLLAKGLFQNSVLAWHGAPFINPFPKYSILKTVCPASVWFIYANVQFIWTFFALVITTSAKPSNLKLTHTNSSTVKGWN